MFDFFKKKEVDYGIYTPVQGQFIKMEDIPDPVFSEKMMGEGFAIKPKSSDVYSPVSGTVTMVFSSKHAIGIESTSGKNVIVHMGLETVNLEGRPFQIYVKEGQKISHETKLARVDLEMLAEEEKEDMIIIAFPEITAGELIFPENDDVELGIKIVELTKEEK
ncbi:MAG: PTS glucose transporter subunit IIA [Lactovum sp.]